MNVFQIMKVVIDGHNKKNKIKTEIVSGPAYIHKKDAWACIEKLVNDDLRKYMRNIRVYSIFSDAQVDCVGRPGGAAGLCAGSERQLHGGPGYGPSGAGHLCPGAERIL